LSGIHVLYFAALHDLAFYHIWFYQLLQSLPSSSAQNATHAPGYPSSDLRFTLQIRRLHRRYGNMRDRPTLYDLTQPSFCQNLPQFQPNRRAQTVRPAGRNIQSSEHDPVDVHIHNSIAQDFTIP
jgi:hypothetical protein